MYWFLLLLLCSVLGHEVMAVEVVLLDITNLALGNWMSVQHDGDPSITGNNQALYQWTKIYLSDRKPQLLFVCSHNRATTVPQDNWIRSPFFAIEDAVVVSLDISSDVEKCNFASHPNCKEEFSVYFQFADSADNSDPINGTYFRLSVRLPQDKSQLNQISNFIKAVNVTVPRKRGMFIAFRDTGGCTHIHKAIVRYNYCPSVTENLADFPRTVARASQVHVVGKCRENAFPQSRLPQKLCRASGEWSTLQGSCECNAGHRLAEDVCKVCGNGTYKHLPGNTACLPCPLNSRTVQEGSINCTCVGKFFRLTGDPAENCTAPPSAIRNGKIEEIKPTSVRLSWDPPEDFGDRTDLSYKISMWQNGKLINDDRRDSTSFTFDDLAPKTYYNMSVTSYNGAGNGPEVVFNVTTATEPVTPSLTPSTAVMTSVDSTSKSVSDTSTVRPTGKSDASLSTAAIVGIGVAALVLVVILLLILYRLYKKLCQNGAHAGTNEENDKLNDHKPHNATTPL